MNLCIYLLKTQITIIDVKLLQFFFQNQIRAHQEILTDLLEAHTVKTITLKAIRKGIQQLQQSLSIHQKNSVSN